MTESAEIAATQPEPARRVFRGRGWFWGVAAPLVAVDLWSKQAVFAFLAAEQPYRQAKHRQWSVWETGPIDFSLVSWGNPGTIWGLAQDYTIVLVLARCIALGVIGYFLFQLPRVSRLFQAVLGLIMAGAVGNLYDNFTEEGREVRDFLRFQGEIFGWRWDFPAFNVADSCICVGAITLAILLWRADETPPSKATPADAK